MTESPKEIVNAMRYWLWKNFNGKGFGVEDVAEYTAEQIITIMREKGSGLQKFCNTHTEKQIGSDAASWHWIATGEVERIEMVKDV